MFQIGDMVVYGVHGVCKIVELQTQRVDRKKVEYFVLEPIFQMTSRFFVPSQNEVALSKLRPVLSKEEIEALLLSEESHKENWIEDENQRKLEYKKLIATGDGTMSCTVEEFASNDTMIRTVAYNGYAFFNAHKKFLPNK